MRRSERRDAGSNPAPAASLATSVGQRSVRKSSGRMRALSRKQVASSSRLWVRVPRLPLGVAERIEGETGNSGPLPREPLSASASPFTRAYRPTGRCRSCKPEIRVQLPIGPLARQRFCRNFDSRGPAATTPGLHPGNDGSSPSGSIFTNGTGSASVCQPAEQPGLNPGECGFESRLRHCPEVMASRRGTQTGQAAKLKPSCLVGSSPTRAIPFTTCLCGAARSARHPVTVEVRGSNPLRDAGAPGAGPVHAAKASASDWPRPRDSCLASAGHWRALGAVTPAPQAVQVQLLLDAFDRFSITTARSSSGTGCWPLMPATRVRIPHGSLVAASSGRGDARMPSGSPGCA